MGHLVFRTNSNICIYTNDSFHQHFGISDEVITMALNDSQKAIAESIEKNVECVVTKEYDFNVGVTHCIEVPMGANNIYFKQRGTRKYLSRMIKGALPQPTNCITLILRKTGEWSMTIITGWTGKPAQPELGNISYFEKAQNPMAKIETSARFWTTHALIEENPSPQELYDDVIILCERLNIDIQNLDYDTLRTIITARLGKEIPTQIPGPESTDEEGLTQWMQTHIIPLYEEIC